MEHFYSILQIGAHPIRLNQSTPIKWLFGKPALMELPGKLLSLEKDGLIRMLKHNPVINL